MKLLKMAAILLLGVCVVSVAPVQALAAQEYKEYITSVSEGTLGNETSEIDIFDFTVNGTQAKTEKHYNGNMDTTLVVGQNGEVSFNFDIKKQGLYCLKLRYYPVESKNFDVKIGIKVDGSYPFEEAESITLKKIFINKNDKKTYDNRGNEILSEKIQVVRLVEDYARSFLGNIKEPYYFDLSPGKHTLTLVMGDDSLAIAGLTFCLPESVPSYSEYSAEKHDNNAENGYKQYIQAEDVNYTTSSMMTAKNDRTSPLTVPQDSYNILYNTFGGSSWSKAGEYAMWNFFIPASGYYKIGIKYRQNGSKAILPVRKFYIDNEVPFTDCESVSFPYGRDWQYAELKGGEETAEIYLTEGDHTLKIESVLGEFSDSFEKIEDIAYELNSCYRSIIMITGTSPDIYRDYQLGVKLPDIIEKMGELSEQLTSVLNILDSKKIGNNETIEITTIRDQIDEFTKDPDCIPEKLESFKTNIGALSDWCVSAKSQSVVFDYFVISSIDNTVGERVKANIFEKALHELKALISSFVNDYSNIGGSYTYDESITVWIMSGRDQANTLKSIIESDFMIKNSIAVDLKLTNASLLSALVADKGPDVALGLGNSDPVNYALRKAVADLSEMDGFDEVSSWFYPSAIEPFSFNGGVYALPETQVFPVMFYRTDVLEQLKLKVPQTWDEVSNCLTELSNVNMEFGLSCADSTSTMSSMGMFLYQNGGSFYINGDTESGLTTETALNSFKTLTNLYNGYRLPYSFSDLNRFRSGEMPLVIANYSLYNTLCVSAPEIDGLWDIALVPGSLKEDGSIDHSVMGTATGTVITSSAKNIEAAWKFLKWWVSEDTQATYGLRIEALMGQAARYATANIEAMSRLPWTNKELASLKKQQEYVKATPEVPGSYFTPRHLYNAFRRVITYADDPRQTLLDYSDSINREIEAKRKEFGLS